MTDKIKPAQATLNALRDGQAMNELAQAIHDATCAVRDFNKPAKVTLTIEFAPLKGGTVGLLELPIIATAEIATKLPKPEADQTIFYVDKDGNPTRNAPEREPDLGLQLHHNQGSDA